MPHKISAMQVAAESLGKIRPYYDLRVSHADEIYRQSPNVPAMILNAFKFGYMQGTKAEQTRQKRGK